MDSARSSQLEYHRASHFAFVVPFERGISPSLLKTDWIPIIDRILM